MIKSIAGDVIIRKKKKEKIDGGKDEKLYSSNN